ncbi:MAG: hypothetical protein GWP56_03390 [Gammaproteobacteria bacterium]|nr:hypothetical protein [Gammaproteobacteria bacterium]
MSAAATLQQKIRNALGMDAIEVSAPLPPNVNIHGTGFAGSIYSVAVLTGWALCTHILEQKGVAAELVVTKAEIRYRAPITGDLCCAIRIDAAERAAFLAGIRDQGKGVLRLNIDVGGRPEAVLKGTYWAIAQS